MSTITPYLCVADGRAAMDWYQRVFDAQVSAEAIFSDDGRLGHVEMSVGGARFMMSEEFDSAGVAAPLAERGSDVSLHLSVDDVDALAERAESAGATIARRPEDTPHGRIAVLLDPAGHRWMLNQSPA